MTPLLTITFNRGKSALLLLENRHNLLHSIIICLRRSLKAQFIPFVFWHGGFDAVPDNFPVVHGGFEGLDERRDVCGWERGEWVREGGYPDVCVEYCGY
jgi:hypothetical protein